LTQPGFIAASAGKTFSQLIFRPQFNAMGGPMRDAELVQTYVPARESGIDGSGWVFEIYSDAKQTMQIVGKMHKSTALWLIGLMAILFIFVNWVVLKGARILREESCKREEELRRVATKEHSMERDKNFFLAAATHELRTPMTCILGFAELLEKRDYDSAQVRSLSNIIRKKSQEMNRLLDDLLDVSALDEASSMAVLLKPSDIAQAVETAVHRLEGPSINRRIALRVEPALPAVMLDGDRFVQAIL